MEPLSSYTVSRVSEEQVRDYTDLARLAGVSMPPDFTRICLQLLKMDIGPEPIQRLCTDIVKEKKRNASKRRPHSISNA